MLISMEPLAMMETPALKPISVSLVSALAPITRSVPPTKLARLLELATLTLDCALSSMHQMDKLAMTSTCAPTALPAKLVPVLEETGLPALLHQVNATTLEYAVLKLEDVSIPSRLMAPLVMTTTSAVPLLVAKLVSVLEATGRCVPHLTNAWILVPAMLLLVCAPL